MYVTLDCCCMHNSSGRTIWRLVTSSFWTEAMGFGSGLASRVQFCRRDACRKGSILYETTKFFVDKGNNVL